MRCKPGDLAVCIAPDNLGALVRVIRTATSEEQYEGEDWLCENLSPMKDCLTRQTDPAGCFGVMFDTDLRPIRDPGEDAKDETLDWLPVPERESELTEELVHAFEREFLLQYIQRMERT